MMLVLSEQRRKRRDKWKRKQDGGGNVSPRSRAYTRHLTNPWKKKKIVRNNTDTLLFIAGTRDARGPWRIGVNWKNKSRRTRRPADNAAVYESFHGRNKWTNKFT